MRFVVYLGDIICNMKKVISVVVPVYNEEVGIRDFLTKELMPVLDGLKYKTEVI